MDDENVVNEMSTEAIEVASEAQPAAPTAEAQLSDAQLTHMGASFVLIATLVRTATAVAKSPALNGFWKPLPWWGKIAFLLSVTAVGFMVDAFAMGQNWVLAAGSAITGLGAAVVSHEWQALFKEAMEEKKLEEEEAEQAAHKKPDVVETAAEVSAPIEVFVSPSFENEDKAGSAGTSEH
jgi:hypothetical protein